MSGPVIADHRPPCHLIQSAASVSEYTCTDCGRTFRRHATYRRHRQLSHDDVTETFSTHHLPLSSLPRRLPNVTSSSPIGRDSDVMVDMETVENCCVDNEISLGENSSGAEFSMGCKAEEFGLVNKSTCHTSLDQRIVGSTTLASSNIHEDTASGRCQANYNLKSEDDPVTVKIEQVDDESIYEDDEELADFRSTSADRRQESIAGARKQLLIRKPASVVFDEKSSVEQVAVIQTNSHGSMRRDQLYSDTKNAASQVSFSTNVTPEIKWSQVTGGSYVKDEKMTTTSSVPISGSISFIAAASGAAASSVAAAPKIFVYVKTEPQGQYCSTSAFAINNGDGRMMPDDQMSQPMHAANSKPSGCQFVCPICQRLFNSEKYLSMHMSSIHRAPDNVLLQQQQQPHQQSAKQVAPIESAPTPVKFTTSTVVSSSATARRTPGSVPSKPVVPVHTSIRLAACPPRQASSAEVALVPQSAVTVVPAVTVAVAQQHSSSLAPMTSAGVGAGNVAHGGPARSSTQWTCNICNKSFAQNSSYKNHIRTHSDDRPYVCSICSIGFKERYHLKKHALFKHTTELNETCRVCGKRFKDSTAVRAHERIHSDVRPYGCTLCGKTFKTSECLWHHENRSKTCGKMAVAAAMSSGTMIGVDNRTVARRQVPQQHDTRTQTVRRQRRTPAVAGLNAVTRSTPSMIKSTSTLDEIQSAVAVITSKPLAAQVPETRLVSSVPLSSTSTSVIFSQMAGVAHQMMAPTEVNRTREGSFTTTTHQKMASPNTGTALKNNTNATLEPDMTTPNDSIDCELFDDVGLSSMFDAEVDDDVGHSALVDEFWQHFDMDQMTSDYDIYSADTDMIDSASSTTETASSSSETTDDSEMSSAVIDELTKEIRLAASSSHSVDSLQSGDVNSTSSASKTFSVGGVGKRHDCARCDKRFASAATLEKHLLVHAEVRPYRCSVCDIGFKLKVHLKKHNLYRHSDDYPCECSVCGKRFKDSSAVRLHERIHSTDRPFQCLHCGKSFKTKENLWGHRNRGPCDKSSIPSTTMPSCNATTEAVGTSSSPSSSSHVVVAQRAEQSSVVAESNEVTQHYVANNIRLFHSAEFGPILGVPVNARLVFRDAVDGSDVDAAEDPHKSSKSLAVESTVSSSGQVMTSTSTLPVGCLPRLSAAVVGPHDTISIGSSRVVNYVSASTTPPAMLPATVPTAVVAPIKRQTAIASASLMAGELTTSSAVSVRPTSLILPSNVRLVMSADQQSRSIDGRRLVASSAQSASTRKRSNSASIADRCPTVQKYLAFGAANGGNGVVPVDGSGSIPNTIQKLLQLAVPRTTTFTSVSGGTIHVASAASGTLSIIDDVAERLNNTVSSNALLGDDVTTKRHCHDNGGSSCVRLENDELKDMAMRMPPSETGSRVAGDRELQDNWNELTAPIEDAHLLADSTDDDDSADLSDSSNYQLIDVVRSAAAIGRSSDNVNQLMCDDDSDEDGCGKLLDPYAGTLNDDYYISSNGGAADMMWCSSESSWTPDSDLAGLLIFEPN